LEKRRPGAACRLCVTSCTNSQPGASRGSEIIFFSLFHHSLLSAYLFFTLFFFSHLLSVCHFISFGALFYLLLFPSSFPSYSRELHTLSLQKFVDGILHIRITTRVSLPACTIISISSVLLSPLTEKLIAYCIRASPFLISCIISTFMRLFYFSVLPDCPFKHSYSGYLHVTRTTFYF